MRLATFLIAFALGCTSSNRPPPHTSLSQITQGQVVLGAILEAHGSWPTICRWKNKNLSLDDDNEASPAKCEYAQSRVDVTCDGPCRINKRSARPEVTALALGQLVVHVTQTRVDTDQVDRKSFPFEVVKPTKFALECRTARYTYTTCGPDGVDAAVPELRVDVFIGERRQYDLVMQINGKPHELRSSGGGNTVSLADLFPDARDGDGIKPGTYAVELELGGVIERYQVAAH